MRVHLLSSYLRTTVSPVLLVMRPPPPTSSSSPSVPLPQSWMTTATLPHHTTPSPQAHLSALSQSLTSKNVP